ncbi:hypothetical protein MLAC_10910 [Mycobacterium lacus]|uniref:DUF222 domain-containing protein n=1 Tax=Mycobacterium lacus TaxID=169765 RepID=A0A7I7NJW5_9MYCO|nr:hypothetical protein MLAC_10910 [Mycobacterium lacus]
MLAATAAAQKAGKLGAGHIAVIRRVHHRLPGWVDAATRERAQADLARQGSQYRPEQSPASGRYPHAGLADTIADCLNPDGTYRDEDRARRRGLRLGNQQSDGMSELRGMITPELRATLEAVLAKLAAPGMCNPDSDTPCVDGTPSQTAIDTDTRTANQRNHDGLNAALRAMLGLQRFGPAQRATSVDHRAHHPGRAGSRRRHRTHRRRQHPADERRDPPGPPREALSGHLRPGQSPGALSHQTPDLTRGNELSCTPRTAAAQRRAATSRATTPKSITAPPTPSAAPPTSTTRPSPAAAITH